MSKVVAVVKYMEIIDKKAERNLLESFCLNNQMVGDFDFVSYEWSDLKPKLQKFFNSEGLRSFDVEKLKFRHPIRFIVKGQENEILWNEYWSARFNSKELFEYMRNSFCGIGSKKAKILINACPTLDAKIIRKILEIEDITISSQRYYGEFLGKNVDRRNKTILELQKISEKFPEKLRIYEVDNSMVVCDFNFNGCRNQFCWYMENGDKFNRLIKKSSHEFSMIVYNEPKIKRLEKLIERMIG